MIMPQISLKTHFCPLLIRAPAILFSKLAKTFSIENRVRQDWNSHLKALALRGAAAVKC